MEFFKKHIFAIMVIAVVTLSGITFSTIIYNLFYETDPFKWFVVWKYLLTGLYILCFPILVLVLVGGIKDLIVLFKKLKTEIVDENDNGWVSDQK